MRSLSICFGTALAIRCFGFGASAAGQGWHGGVGVIGDSYSDEYQFYPPDRSTARCWVEILATTRHVDFGPLVVDPAQGNSRLGYAYNWARSGATTADMIAEGQHNGVAGQVRSGAVGLVWIFIGGNDFIEGLRAADPTVALDAAARDASKNLDTAIETLLKASPDVKLVVATVPDICDLPEFGAQTLPRSATDAARAAIQRFNRAIWGWRKRDARVTVVDLYWPLKLAVRFTPAKPPLFGVKLDFRGSGNRLQCAFLNDGRHAGLILQALLARLFLDTMNIRFGSGIPPLEDREVLALAESLTAQGGHGARVSAARPPGSPIGISSGALAAP